jgi:very-short-patch-repair endonuclease
MTRLSRELRRTATPAEKMLWLALKNRGFFGYHFRRQVPIGRYILDFYCSKKKLAVEIDGSVHDYQKEYDGNRDAVLSSLGIKVLRFENDAVMNNPTQVLGCIQSHLDNSTFPPP